jgi:TnpA family transposase
VARAIRRAGRNDLLARGENSVCIYSQLKACSSSEVAAMIEGVLRHDTEMDIEKQ